jgi:hypothetical protein
MQSYIATDNLVESAQTILCTHCGAKPVLIPGSDFKTESKFHRLIDLTEENQRYEAVGISEAWSAISKGVVAGSNPARIYEGSGSKAWPFCKHGCLAAHSK